MPQEKLDFIYGKMARSDKYSPVVIPQKRIHLPPRNPKEHRSYLLNQLDKVEAAVKSRVAKKVSEATGAVIAVKAHKDSRAKVESLESKRDGVKVIYEIPEKNIVLLDVSSGELKQLRSKIDKYGSHTRVHPKSKDRTPKPANNALVAPIDRISLAEFSLVCGPELTGHLEKGSTKKEWFEISCRGGVYAPNETDRSRRELRSAVDLLKLSKKEIPEFLAPERVVFFLSATMENLKKLFELTDCIFEVELAARETLNWLLTEKIEVADLPMLKPEKPPKEAGSIVVLDSGINSNHPLLKPSVALEASVHPEDDSPVDTDGHGTEMAGIGSYGESISQAALGATTIKAKHWIESIRIYTHPNSKVSGPSGRRFWAKLMTDAIETSESQGRKIPQKAHCLAITVEHKFPGYATSWSLAVDLLAFNKGAGRLFLISIGNCRPFTQKLVRGYPQENHTFKLEDPSQAFNALTVGGYTLLSVMPQDPKWASYTPLAQPRQISPHTRSGATKAERTTIKPDVVFEGGNVAADQTAFADTYIPTLSHVTTGHDPSKPYVVTCGTSMATALAGKFSLDVWESHPSLRPETIRALIVHSASWTAEMINQLGSKDDRLALAGYGVPSLELATFCSRDRATIIVEDEINNLVKAPKGKSERRVKLFKLPVPKEELLRLHERDVELRVTLSYFAEPNSARGIASRGMDLAWDIQGPAETTEQFLKRINKAERELDEESPGTRSFAWEIGPRRRRRGTLQSDRWQGKAADLAGTRYIAVFPRHGWWSQRTEFQERAMKFSLVVSVITPGIEVYNLIKQAVEIPGTKIPIST